MKNLSGFNFDFYTAAMDEILTCDHKSGTLPLCYCEEQIVNWNCTITFKTVQCNYNSRAILFTFTIL